ncbi:MAG TPA: hypothetical protein VN366_11830 [Feifaniaceae bacterium]|nr:hypothetical protein [Feifaniaceae bacterium]
MKRIFCIGLVLLLVAAAGCAPTTPPANTPSLLPDLTPDVSPDIPGGPGTTADVGGNGTGGNAGAMIPDFAEGTVVNESDVPDIKAALQAQYPGAAITSIKHGMQGTQQAYVVEYTAEGGETGTAYILPDGTILPDTAAASPGASPDTSPGTETTTDGAAASPAG